MTVSAAHELIFMLGRPVAQTKSPGLMNAWFERHRRECVLVPLALSEAGLRSAVELLRQTENARGAIVTLPFKNAIGQYLDELAETARALNAVNAVRRAEDGRLYGDMLDGEAMLRAMEARSLEVHGRRVFLAGCGGAGSAIAFSACAAGARKLRLMDTNPDRAVKLVAVLADRFPACDIGLAPGPGTCDLLVNATPLGMRPSDPLPISLDQAGPGSLAVDAVTSASTTPWVGECRARGIATVDGNALAYAQLPLLLDFFGFH